MFTILTASTIFPHIFDKFQGFAAGKCGNIGENIKMSPHICDKCQGFSAGKCGNIKPGHIIISANASAEFSGNYKGAMLQSIKSASKNDVPLEMVFNDPTRKVTGKFTN